MLMSFQENHDHPMLFPSNLLITFGSGTVFKALKSFIFNTYLYDRFTICYPCPTVIDEFRYMDVKTGNMKIILVPGYHYELY